MNLEGPDFAISGDLPGVGTGGPRVQSLRVKEQQPLVESPNDSTLRDATGPVRVQGSGISSITDDQICPIRQIGE